MKNLFTFLLALTAFTAFGQSYDSYDFTPYPSTYTTIESKSCGHCGGEVPNTSMVGMKCPHCGVIWGRENTSFKTRNIPSSGSAITTQKANLRSGPSTSYLSICSMPALTELSILSKNGSWVKVSYTDPAAYYGSQERIGWVYAPLLKF